MSGKRERVWFHDSESNEAPSWDGAVVGGVASSFPWWLSGLRKVDQAIARERGLSRRANAPVNRAAVYSYTVKSTYPR